MTVSYQYQVASSTSGGFTRLLFMWRGSLYKLIYRELLLFLVFFGILSALYRRAFNESQKRSFEHIVVYCDTFISLIPLSFVLGFYVAYVAGRWWQQYMAIPWPDKVMHSVALYVGGSDEHGRMLRRSLMRYLNLSLILVLRSISSAVKKRFPTLDHVVDSGFMTSVELELFQSVPSQEFNTYWIPCTWFINLLKEARHCQRLPDAQGLKIIMEEFNEFRSNCGLLWSYDWVSIPLVYTQVVTLATYSFFAVALVGRQYIEGVEGKPFQMEIDIYLPIFTILQFFFFMGLLKVAEQLINPFGDDDEDFELNWLIDRHTKVSYLGVDTLMNRCPPLVKDIYFDAEDLTLPYTEAAAAYKKKTYRGSVAHMMVPQEKQTMFLPDISEDNDDCRTNTPTPRTSTTSLAAHQPGSPMHNKRQISESPAAASQLVRNASETIIQFKDTSIDSEQDYRTIAEAVKKLTAKSNVGTPQQVKKSFFGLGKVTAHLHPWPSAANLARYNALNTDMPLSSISIVEQKDNGESATSRRDSLKLKQFSRDSNADRAQLERHPCQTGQNQGFVNSAFSHEKLSGYYGENGEDEVYNRYGSCDQHPCCHERVCCHSGNPNGSANGSSRLRQRGIPKFVARRRKSASTSKKKVVRWEMVVAADGTRNDPNDRNEAGSREKPVEDPPHSERIITHTASSPDLYGTSTINTSESLPSVTDLPNTSLKSDHAQTRSTKGNNSNCDAQRD